MSTLKGNKNVWGVIFPLFILIVLLSGCDNTVVAPRFDEESNTFIIQKSNILAIDSGDLTAG